MSAHQQLELLEGDLLAMPLNDELLDLDEALTKLEKSDQQIAKLVKLRTFAGMNFDEVAAHLGVSVRTAKRNWAFARAWLGREMGQNERSES